MFFKLQTLYAAFPVFATAVSVPLRNGNVRSSRNSSRGTRPARRGITTNAIRMVLVFAFATSILTPIAHAAGGVTLKPGDLIVADGRLLRIDPITGTQTVIVSGDGCCGGQRIAFAPNGDILAIAGGPPRVVRVNPSTGAVATISSGQYFVAPNSVVLAGNGNLLVTDHGFGGVLRVDPLTGVQTIVSSGGNFVAPLSLAVAGNGAIFVADSAAFGGGGGVIRVDPLTGVQTIVSSGGNFYDPTGIAVASNGDLVVADPAGVSHQGGGPGRIIRVDPLTGNQTIVSSAGLLVDPWGITVAGNGDLYITDPHGFDPSAQILKVDPLTGVQSVVSSNMNLVGPTAIGIVSTPSPASSEFRINITAFIPGNNMSASPRPCLDRSTRRPIVRTLYVKTDDRWFDPNATTYRARQVATMIPNEQNDADGIKDGSATLLAQPTRLYADNALPTIDEADDDGVLGDCSLLHEVAFPIVNNVQVTPTRIGPNRVQARFQADVGTGAAFGLGMLCDISWDITVEIETSGSSPQITVRGRHDSFPAYEVYVNDQPVYTKSPGLPPYDLRDLRKLCGSMDVSLPSALP